MYSYFVFHILMKDSMTDDHVQSKEVSDDELCVFIFGHLIKLLQLSINLSVKPQSDGDTMIGRERKVSTWEEINL